VLLNAFKLPHRWREAVEILNALMLLFIDFFFNVFLVHVLNKEARILKKWWNTGYSWLNRSREKIWGNCLRRHPFAITSSPVCMFIFVRLFIFLLWFL